MAFGLDRLAMILGGTDNIRDVIAFPKNLAGVDPMSMAPTEVTAQQLEDLGIVIKDNEYLEVKTEDGTVMTAKQIKELQKRNALLEEENVILKKALAIFTPHSAKG